MLFFLVGIVCTKPNIVVQDVAMLVLCPVMALFHRVSQEPNSAVKIAFYFVQMQVLIFVEFSA